MGQEAATALKPPVVVKVNPEIPAERVYTDERDPSGTMPHIWMYAANESPGFYAWETRDLVYLHIWAKSLGALKDLERKLRPLWGEVIPGNAGDKARGFVYERPTVTRAREGTAWHATMIIPCTYTDMADLEELAMPP